LIFKPSLHQREFVSAGGLAGKQEGEMQRELTERTSATPPLRNRDEAALTVALCLLFDLARTEGRILANLVTREVATQAELRAAINQDRPKVAISSMKIFVYKLRKKLAGHDIAIRTVHRVGYGLRKDSREKILQQLAGYDAGFAPQLTPLELPPRRRAVRPAAETYVANQIGGADTP
jgi:hypothetical protein